MLRNTCVRSRFAAPSAIAAAPSMAAPAAKPTIVLVHGAFADALGWQKLIPILLRDGYTVTAVENPIAVAGRRCRDDQARDRRADPARLSSSAIPTAAP